MQFRCHKKHNWDNYIFKHIIFRNSIQIKIRWKRYALIWWYKFGTDNDDYGDGYDYGDIYVVYGNGMDIDTPKDRGIFSWNYIDDHYLPLVSFISTKVYQYHGFPMRVLLHNLHLSWNHDDVIKWKHFPRYWLFVRGIHRSPVNSPHKGQ